MENFKMYKNFNNYDVDVLDGINAKLKELTQNTHYTLTEQEKLTNKMLTIDELLKVMLDNQIAIIDNINKLHERML